MDELQMRKTRVEILKGFLEKADGLSKVCEDMFIEMLNKELTLIRELEGVDGIPVKRVPKLIVHD